MNKRVPTNLTDGELAALYQQINEATKTGRRDRALCQVMADCGLRVSEALHLQTGDLERQNGRVTALTVRGGKGGQDRKLFCTEQLSDKLLRWLDARQGLGVRRGPVFVTVKGSAGSHLSPRTVQQLVRRLAERAGIEKRVSPHTLRHTAATRRLRAGANLRLIQQDLGHASVQTTQLYTHVVDSERQQAAQNLPAVDGEGAAVKDEQAAVLERLLEQVADFEQQLAGLKQEITATLERRRSHAASDRLTSRGGTPS